MSEISRRNFLVGSALATTGVLAMTSGALAEEADEGWWGADPEVPSTFDAEFDVDVVVVGLGMAGVCATRSACEEGASVVVFEKGPKFGLASTCIAAWGSKMWLEHYPECQKFWQPDQLMATFARQTLGRSNSNIMKRWMEKNGETFDWFFAAMDESYVWGPGGTTSPLMPDTGDTPTIQEVSYPYPKNYDPSREYYPCFPGCVDMLPDNTPFLEACMAKAYAAAGDKLQVLQDTPAVKLLVQNGRVTGVVAHGFDGSWYKANAKSGVVLATGDFFGDAKMVDALLPRKYGPSIMHSFWAPLDAEGNQLNTGDGHKMATRIGAMMQLDGAAMSHFVGGAAGRIFGTMPFLYLDVNGKRFMNEDVQGQQLVERTREVPQQRIYQIFDGNWVNHRDDFPYGHGKRPEVTPEDLEYSVENGGFVRYDTLEDLLESIDIDVEAAKASIERYNKLCHEGRDVDFGKAPHHLWPVEEPPFYCDVYDVQDLRFNDLVTVSGLESDEEAHVYDQDFDVIPGLYVAGNTQGGRFALEYPEVLEGLSLGMAMVYGRIAGKNATLGI